MNWKALATFRRKNSSLLNCYLHKRIIHKWNKNKVQFYPSMILRSFMNDSQLWTEFFMLSFFPYNNLLCFVLLFVFSSIFFCLLFFYNFFFFSFVINWVIFFFFLLRLVIQLRRECCNCHLLNWHTIGSRVIMNVCVCLCVLFHSSLDFSVI